MFLLFAAALAVRVDVLPASMNNEYQLLKRQAPDSYACNLSIEDEKSKKTVGTFELFAAPAAPQTVVKNVDDYTIEFTVIIRPGEVTNTADVRVIVRQKDEIVVKQRSTISLLHEMPHNMPLR